MLIDIERRSGYIINSLQTLHRMPSDTWERRPVFPTFIYSDNKTIYDDGYLEKERSICKNDDQICKNGDQNHLQKR